MAKQSELRAITGEWISKAKQGCSPEIFNGYREKFGRLEKEAFGEVSERCKNPIAMQYDLIRNVLVRYSSYGKPEDLEVAAAEFSKVTNEA